MLPHCNPRSSRHLKEDHNLTPCSGRLIDAGAQVNAGGAGGSCQMTALHHAAMNHQLEAVKKLVDNGARWVYG